MMGLYVTDSALWPIWIRYPGLYEKGDDSGFASFQGAFKAVNHGVGNNWLLTAFME